jgi:hypothetical protein
MDVYLRTLKSWQALADANYQKPTDDIHVRQSASKISIADETIVGSCRLASWLSASKEKEVLGSDENFSSRRRAQLYQHRLRSVINVVTREM